MACIRKRRGKWVVDYRDGGGRRRWVTCRTKREAEDVLAEKLVERSQAIRPAVEPRIRVENYSERWLDLVSTSIKPSTRRSYELMLRQHLLPAFGRLQVRQLVRGQIKQFLADKLSTGLSRNSVRIILATLRAMLQGAVDDGVLLANPADRLGRQLRLTTSAKDREQEIKALDRQQLYQFLVAAKKKQPRYHGLLFTMARTGLRVGEALGLCWEDIDFRRREIRVERSLSNGQIGTTKSGRARNVDMSLSLRALLKRLETQHKRQVLRKGPDAVPSWVFVSRAGTAIDPSRVAKVFKLVLAAAELPKHFSPHCLRHTFASQLLQQGESAAYVQRQLGHASIQLTVDTYGRWLPMGNKAAVDRLDESDVSDEIASGSKTVANEGSDPLPDR